MTDEQRADYARALQRVWSSLPVAEREPASDRLFEARTLDEVRHELATLIGAARARLDEGGWDGERLLGALTREWRQGRELAMRVLAAMERQRLWSTWLDGHCGPGPGGQDLHLADALDRDELAELLADAVETLEPDQSPLRRDDRVRWWRQWLANATAIHELELEVGADREVLAERLAEAVPKAPERR